ncbi:MAG: 50S ribosomal protein L2 [Candidatus Azambacteria bacterium]|nr:50S ribosomal protein L2 [Candidatus Azambacteria bacterium]
MKLLRPTSPGQRQRTIADYSSLTKKEPEKSLTFGRKRRMGRSKQGRITTRHRGGGNKRLYREIDFKQNKMNIPGKVISLEYDPNRSSFISLIQYHDGEKRYSLAVKNMKVGDPIITSEDAPLTDGNRLPLAKIPTSFFVHNIELQPARGGQIVRSAGSSAKVMAHEGKYTHIQMPSSEVRKILSTCLATIGVLSNPEHNLINYGKAGASRWRGIRPTVRGSAMNPCDHPHGGGEGAQPIGLPYPKTPWGKHALGKKTRKKNHATNKFIVSRRVKK